MLHHILKKRELGTCCINKITTEWDSLENMMCLFC